MFKRFGHNYEVFEEHYYDSEVVYHDTTLRHKHVSGLCQCEELSFHLTLPLATSVYLEHLLHNQ